ncbi:putative GNAT family acetyltransferase [Pseudorhizobium tarimense]|uniref:GNAT family acetyltransferase n=1 Tax=Pseudorhizobium tarimense TaxID=1079109 RepID=A0ABV2H7M4_9HYPH
MAAYAVEDARWGGWKIMPLCPFFKSQAMRHSDWQDVISG